MPSQPAPGRARARLRAVHRAVRGQVGEPDMLLVGMPCAPEREDGEQGGGRGYGARADRRGAARVRDAVGAGRVAHVGATMSYFDLDQPPRGPWRYVRSSSGSRSFMLLATVTCPTCHVEYVHPEREFNQKDRKSVV